MMGKVKIKVKIIIQMGKVKIIKENIQHKQTWSDMWGEMFHPDIFHKRIFFNFFYKTTIQSLMMIFTKVVENPKMDYWDHKSCLHLLLLK